MDYYQKPALFAIFLSFAPQTLTMCSEIIKIKLPVDQTHKQVGQIHKNGSFIKFCPIIKSDHLGFSFADATRVY